MAPIWGSNNDPWMASRKKVVRGQKRARGRKPAARVDICGQEYAVDIDPTLKVDGYCIFEENRIVLSPKAFWRMVDTYLHEMVHALIDASGMSYSMRRRLKMSRAQWQEFEETYIVRPMTPALLATLKSAGMFRAPAFLRKLAKAA